MLSSPQIFFEYFMLYSWLYMSSLTLIDLILQRHIFALHVKIAHSEIKNNKRDVYYANVETEVMTSYNLPKEITLDTKAEVKFWNGLDEESLKIIWIYPLIPIASLIFIIPSTYKTVVKFSWEAYQQDIKKLWGSLTLGGHQESLNYLVGTLKTIKTRRNQERTIRQGIKIVSAMISEPVRKLTPKIEKDL